MRWTDTDLAYFAGLLDGEGSFGLGNTGTHRFVCRVAIGNTDIRMLEWVKTHFGGNIAFEKRNNPKHKPVWRWVSEANSLDDILPAILPYLIIKKDRAELLIAYRRTLASKTIKKRSTNNTPESVKVERSQIHSELALLNRRGA